MRYVKFQSFAQLVKKLAQNVNSDNIFLRFFAPGNNNCFSIMENFKNLLSTVNRWQ